MADRSIKVVLSAQIADFKRQMDEASRSAKKVGEETAQSSSSATTALGRITRSALDNREAWDRSGTALTAFGAATTAALGLSVKAAIDWESAWAGVAKTVNGTDAELDAVEQGLRELARTLPATHQEIAATAEAAGQLGVATKDVVSFTKTMIDLSETTNLTADEAATSIAQLMNVMQTAPEDVDNLGASLVALGNNGASTERDIIQMAQRIAGSGKIIGLSEAQVMGLANALASVGIEVEAGGSAISNVMTDIAKSVSSGGEDLRQWARVAGMTAGDFAAAWKADPADALATVIEGLGRMNAAGEDVFSTLSDLGQSDVRVSRALLSMANAGDLLRESLDLGTQAWSENTALLAEAEKRYDTTAAKMEIARNSINDAAITLGETFLPAVAGAAEGIADLAQWLGSLPTPIQNTVAGLGGLVGVVGLAAGGFLLTFPRVVETYKALQTLATISPRATTALGKVSKAAGVAAVALGVFEVAAALAGTGMDDLPGVSAVTKELLNLGDASEEVTPNAAAARDSIEEMLTVAGSGGTKIQGLADAIEAANMNGFLKSLDWVGSVGGMFDREFELGTEAVKTFDSAITSMAQSGATQDVANALAYFDEQAQAAGVSVDVARAGLSQYNEYLASADVQQVSTASSAEQLATSMGYTGGMTEEAAAALQKWRDMVSASDQNFIDLQGAYDDVITKNQEYAQATADATESAEDSWETYYDGQAVSAEDYIAQMQAQVDAQNNWESNMLAIAQRVNEGMTGEMREAAEGMIDELLELGPEGAAQVELLKNMTDEQFAQVVTLWAEKGTAAVGEFVSTVEGYRQPVVTPTVDTSGAEETLRGFTSKTWTTYVDAITRDAGTGGGGGRTLRQARGAVVDYFADGAENHVAQIAPAGSWRVWAEPETGGEAYIPLASSKRARSLDIWSQVGRRLGVAGYADGGMRYSTAVAGWGSPLARTTELAPRVGSVTQHITTSDPLAAGIAGVRRLNDLVV